MSHFFLFSLPPHISLSSQTPEWLAPFCFITHQTGLAFTARPLDQGSATSAEAGADGGMHISQGDTWETGADVAETGTAGWGRATGRQFSTG